MSASSRSAPRGPRAPPQGHGRRRRPPEPPRTARSESPSPGAWAKRVSGSGHGDLRRSERPPRSNGRRPALVALRNFLLREPPRGNGRRAPSAETGHLLGPRALSGTWARQAQSWKASYMVHVSMWSNGMPSKTQSPSRHRGPSALAPFCSCSILLCSGQSCLCPRVS